MTAYNVTLSNGEFHQVTAAVVHITEQGVKFLDGQGRSAAVIAFYNHQQVRYVRETHNG